MKTFKELQENKELMELNILRKGSALVFGSAVRTAGTKVQQHLKNSVSAFYKAKQQKEAADKLDDMLEGLIELARAEYQQRIMLGNMTGISVSQSFLNQRNNKDLIKQLKRK